MTPRPERKHLPSGKTRGVQSRPRRRQCEAILPSRARDTGPPQAPPTGRSAARPAKKHVGLPQPTSKTPNTPPIRGHRRRHRVPQQAAKRPAAYRPAPQREPSGSSVPVPAYPDWSALGRDNHPSGPRRPIKRHACAHPSGGGRSKRLSDNELGDRTVLCPGATPARGNGRKRLSIIFLPFRPRGGILGYKVHGHLPWGLCAR